MIDKFPICRIRLKLLVETFEPSTKYGIKISNALKPMKKKICIKTLGNSLINSQMSPPFLIQLLSLLDLVKLKKSRKIRMGLRFFGRVYFETFRLQNSVHAPGDWKEGLLAGIKRDKQWPINWCTSPMMIHKITPYVD